MPLLIVAIFIPLFFWLVYSKKEKFSNKKRLLQIELGLISLVTIIMIIIGGVGITLAFLLIWVAVALVSYYIYLKKSSKVGFIGVNFCAFFSIVFLILQIWLYGTEY